MLTERDIPITRPENYRYTPEEIALLKKQADDAYVKWVQLELEIAKYNLEQQYETSYHHAAHRQQRNRANAGTVEV